MYRHVTEISDGFNLQLLYINSD